MSIFSMAICSTFPNSDLETNLGNIKNIKTRLNIPQRPASLTTIGYFPFSGFVLSFINEQVFL
jgi:hypothetical protein